MLFNFSNNNRRCVDCLLFMQEETESQNGLSHLPQTSQLISDGVKIWTPATRVQIWALNDNYW